MKDCVMSKGFRSVSSSMAQIAMLLIATPAFAVANFTATDVSAIAADEPLLEFAAHIELANLLGDSSEQHQSSVPVSEYRTFSGIGAIVCSADGERRSATAFLVGGFDIAVTVAHAFEFASRVARAQDCEYLVYGPLGLIRERIPVARITASGDLNPGPSADPTVIWRSFACIPRRTCHKKPCPSPDSHTGAPVSLVGFSRELSTDPQQRRLRGHVYLRPQSNCVKFSHDVDPKLISSGAPLIDSRNGVVIGIHSYLREPLTNSLGRCKDRGNTMLLMNDWLEQTLRAEIASSPTDPRAPPRTAP
jgi:hypothetical protein